MSYELKTDIQGVTCLSFPHLEVPHGFSTRLGGVSQGEFASLNLGWKTSDDPEHLAQNQARFEESVGFLAPPTLAMVHGAEVAVLEHASGHRVPGDACVTATRGLGLSLTTADCVPIFYHDPRHNVVALAHAGWRGTVAGVALTTLAAMQQRFGSRSDEVRVGIGPAIGPCCFEVDHEVAKAFQERFGREELLSPRGTKWLVNLWQANRQLLLEAGVRSEDIAVSSLCTVCRSDLFFSYRRDRGQTGRMLAAILAP